MYTCIHWLLWNNLSFRISRAPQKVREGQLGPEISHKCINTRSSQYEIGMSTYFARFVHCWDNKDFLRWICFAFARSFMHWTAQSSSWQINMRMWMMIWRQAQLWSGSPCGHQGSSQWGLAAWASARALASATGRWRLWPPVALTMWAAIGIIALISRTPGIFPAQMWMGVILMIWDSIMIVMCLMMDFTHFARARTSTWACRRSCGIQNHTGIWIGVWFSLRHDSWISSPGCLRSFSSR